MMLKGVNFLNKQDKTTINQVYLYLLLRNIRTYAKLRWLGAKPQTVQIVQVVRRGEATTPTSVLR